MLTGTFLADFQSFFYATQKAEAGLESMKKESLATEKQIDKMVERFRGDRVVAEAAAMAEAIDRLGDKADLTEKELAQVASKATEAASKLKAMGADVPENIQKYATAAGGATTATAGLTKGVMSLAGAFGVAFTADAVIGGIVNFTKGLFQSADALVKVSDQTGMTIEQVQRLSYVANQSGTTFDAMSNAVGKLQGSLDDAKIQQTLREIGISVDEFARSGAYEQTEMLADAIGQIPDPADRARVAMDLWGKSGREMLPAMTQGFKDLAAEATVASEATVRTLEAAGDAIDRWKTKIKNAATEGLGSFLLAAEQLGNMDLSEAFKVALASGSMSQFLLTLKEIKLAKDDLKKDVALPYEGPQTLDMGGFSDEEKKQINDAYTAYQKVVAAQKELTEAGRGWDALLASVTPKQQEQIRQYTEMGVAQQTIATALEVTARQVEAVVRARQQEAAATKIVQDAAQAHHTAQIDAVATQEQKQMLAIGTWRATQMKALADSGAATAEHYDAIDALYTQKLQEQNDAQAAALAKRTGASQAALDQEAAAFQRETDAMVAAYIDMQYGAGAALDSVAAKTREVTVATVQLNTALGANKSAWESVAAGHELMNAYRGAGVAMGSQLAMGGYNQSMRMRAGIPTSQDVFGLTPGAPGGGAWGNQNTLTVNVNNADATQIADKLVREMKHQGVRL
jgi:predicted XRE-type DNA-binding protein